jgi:UDP-N-acetyl-D-glucosamine dehydrogenase
MKVAVVGLGYVGLPLSLQFGRSCVTVLGVDVDAEKVEMLNRGQSYIKHINSRGVAELLGTGKLSATTDFSRIRDVDSVIICVPTPLTKNREPDISYILDTGKAIAPYLRKGTLVVLESTTYPGTTEDELRRVLEENAPLDERPGITDQTSAARGRKRRANDSGSRRRQMKAGVDFHLAYSPEREDPANDQSKVKSIPKIVGGYTPACLKRAVALYSRAIDTIVPVSSCRVAEAAKLLENIFRSVNIALINELKLIYAAMGIDIWEVIEAAKTKPFGFMPFYPGPRLGRALHPDRPILSCLEGT